MLRVPFKLHSWCIHGVFMVSTHQSASNHTQICQNFALIAATRRMVLAPFSRATPSLPTTNLLPTYYQHPLALDFVFLLRTSAIDASIIALGLASVHRACFRSAVLKQAYHCSRLIAAFFLLLVISTLWRDPSLSSRPSEAHGEI